MAMVIVTIGKSGLVFMSIILGGAGGCVKRWHEKTDF
jgi:hypothetical protein